MQSQEKTKTDIKTESKRRIFGQLLKDKGFVTDNQIQEALAIQKQKGGPIGDILVSLHYVTNDQIMLAMGEYLGQEIINIEGMDIPSEIINMISPAIAQLYRIIPIHLKNDTLTIVQADALNFATMDFLMSMPKVHVNSILFPTYIVIFALEKYYP